jgi:hypothetical protein
MSTTLKFQYNDDIRRVNIPDKEKFTFEELTSKIKQVYKTIPSGWKSICVKYLDDEGDLVTVTTTEELRESFTSFSKNAATLKFFISFVYPEAQEKAPAHCDFSKWAEYQQKFWQLHSSGIKHMDNKDYVAARECFIEQVHHCKKEWHTRVPLYNIACCESLIGNVTTAFEYLQKAINAGFRNCEKIQSDPDFENLREKSHAKFQELLEELKKDGRRCWRRKFCKAEEKESDNASAPENTEDIKPIIKRCHLRRSESEDLSKHCKWSHFRDQMQQQHCAEGEISHPWKRRYGGPCMKKWKQEQMEKQIEKQPDPIVLPKAPEITQEPEITKEPVVETKIASPLVETPILPKEEKIEEPAIIHKKCFAKRLAALEEMGFTDKGKNVKALVAAKGNPRIAVSILLDQGQ